jgi:LysR family transcriptional activator of nhaA
MLLPTPNTMVRRAFDHWFESADVRPLVVGEFEDSALLKVFGQQGFGLFPGPSAIAREIQKQYDVRMVGEVEPVRERFYAISMERRVKHPAVMAIADLAHRRLFD